MSLATVFLRISADASHLGAEVEGAGAEAGKKAAAAYQKSFNASMRGKQLFNTTDQAIAQAKRDGEAYAAKLKSTINKAGKISFVALVAGAVVATKMAADFQTQLTRMVTSAGESQKNIALLSRGLLNLSVVTGTSTTNLANGLYLIESAGYHGADGLRVLTAAAKGARTENADLKDVSDALTTGLKDYNLTGKDATKVMNVYIAAVSHGKTTFQDFSASLSTVQALAAAAHISIADMAGVLATLTDHGVNAAEATQQMAFTIRNLEAPNNVAVNAMAQLGISATDVSQNLGKRGLSGTVEYLSQTILQKMGPSGTVLLNAFNQSKAAATDAATALSKLPPQAKATATAYADGKITLAEYRAQLKGMPADQAALARQWQAMQDKSKGFSQELKNGTPQAKTYQQELQKMLGGANGLQVALQLGSDGFVTMNTNVKATTDAYKNNSKQVSGFAAVQKTANFQFSAAKEALSKIAIEFGAHILPPATAFFKLLANNSGLLKGLVITLGVIGTLLANMFVIQKITAFVKGVQGITLAFKGLRTATEADTVAQVANDAAMDANPIGAIVLAVEALIVAVAALIYYRKQIADFFLGGSTAARLAMIPIGAFSVLAIELTQRWGTAVSTFKGIGAWFAGPFVNFFVTAGKDIAAPFLWLWHNVIDPAWQGIVNSVKLAVATVKAVISGVTHFIEDVGKIFTWLYVNVIKPVFAAAAIPIGIFGKIVELVFKSIELVLIFAYRSWLTVFHGIADAATWVGKQIYNFFIAPAISWFKLVVSWGSWLWHEIVKGWNWLASGISAAWNWVYKNIILWIYNEGVKLRQFWNDLFNKYILPYWNGFKKGVAGVWSWIVDNIWNKMKDLVTKKIPGWWDTGVKAIGKVWDGLKSIAKEPIKFFVNTILDDGLIAAFNWVDGALGSPVKKISPYKLPDGFATGGYTGDGAKYQPMGVVHGGEYVLTKEQTNAIGVGNLNRIFGKGRLPKMPGDTSQGVALPGYADGGLVGWLKGAWSKLTDPVGSIKSEANKLISQIPGAGSVTGLIKGAAGKVVSALASKLSGIVGGSDYGPVGPTVKAAQDFIKSQNHHPYVWAGAGPSGADCSGFVSEVYNILKGNKSPWGHTFSTSDESNYFLPGRGIFTAGWSNPGETGGGDVGHTAGNLAGLAFESGGAGGDMHYGPGSTPVTSFAHIGHMKGYSGGGSVTNDHGVTINLYGSELTAAEQWAHLNAALARSLRSP